MTMKKILFIFVLIGCGPLLTNAQSPYSDTLSINNVEATVFVSGNYFWDLQGAALYHIPAGTSKSTIFMLSPWLAGFDADDSLHLAAINYSGNEFLPGPIVDIANFNDLVTAQQYNRIWKIYRWQVEEFKQQWQLGNVTNGTYPIPEVINTWPGNHPGTLDRLAPYYDNNQDGSYNPLDGDYPEIKGDEMLWWVYNDNTLHESSEGVALGAEYRVSFYAFNYNNPPNDSVAAINNITFLNIEVVNRSNNDYYSTMFGIFSDLDIGYAMDDYIGCHVDFNSFYGYNGANVDGTGQFNAYGGPTPPPPAQSITFLSGPEADAADGIDNNRNGTIDEPGECWGMSHFIHISSDFNIPTNYPQTPYEYYNYMQSVWKDSTHLVYGGQGYIYDTTQVYTETNYAFPGTSDPQGWGQNGQVMPPWDETANPGGDRKGLGSCGPFTFEQNEIFTVDLALIFAQADTGSPFSSVEENFGIIEDVIEWFNTGSFPSGYNLRVNESEKEIAFRVFPNPASETIQLDIYEGRYLHSKLEIFNQEGKLVMQFPQVQNQMQIDISHLPGGVYYLKLISNQSVGGEKFVKM